MKATEAPIRHLVIYSSGMIGDFMMLLGMSENARLSHPELQVTFLVTRSASFFREILGYQYPYIEVLSLKQEKETFVKYLVRITKNLLGIALSKMP